MSQLCTDYIDIETRPLSDRFSGRARGSQGDVGRGMQVIGGCTRELLVFTPYELALRKDSRNI